MQQGLKSNGGARLEPFLSPINIRPVLFHVVSFHFTQDVDRPSQHRRKQDPRGEFRNQAADFNLGLRKPIRQGQALLLFKFFKAIPINQFIL